MRQLVRNKSTVSSAYNYVINLERLENSCCFNFCDKAKFYLPKGLTNPQLSRYNPRIFSGRTPRFILATCIFQFASLTIAPMTQLFAHLTFIEFNSVS
jgi:hypothetical protein